MVKHAEKKNKRIAVAAPQNAVSPAIADYVAALIDPFGSEAVNVPSPFPYRRVNVREIKEFDLKDYYMAGTPGPDATPGSCFIEIVPRINNTVTITANSFEAPSADNLSGSISGHTDGDPVFGSPPVNGVLTRRCVQQMHQYKGEPAFELTTSAATTAMFQFSVISAAPASSTFKVGVSYNDGAWFTPASNETPSFWPGGVGSVTLALPAGVQAIRFYVVDGNDSKTKASYELAVNITITSGGIGCSNSLSTMTTFSMDLESRISDMESYGVTALGALVSFQGSDLKNGGKIYGAWVPIDWQPDTDSILQSMSTIAYDRYDGALRDGLHSHWFPSRLSELEMTSVGKPEVASKKLVIFVSADDNTQTTRLRLTMHQQYYSQSPAYGNMRYGPSSNRLAVGLCWLAQNVPLITCNDRHLVEKAIKMIQKGGKAGLKYAMDHPEEVASAIGHVASLLV